MKGATWLPSTSQLLPIPTILPHQGIMNMSVSDQRGVVVLENGEVWEICLLSMGMNQIHVPIAINTVSCYESITLIVGGGCAYVCGEDKTNSGLLGGLSRAKEPFNIQIKAFVTKGALNNHAAVIDDEGNIYTWGAGDCGQLGRNCLNDPNPCKVENGSLFRASEIVCGQKFTGVLTDGCYVYVYGAIGNAHKNARRSLRNRLLPYSHPELERLTAIEIAAGHDFLCVLVEGGEVYSYDACIDLVKLPLPQGVSIQKIACCKDSAIGLAENEIVEWGQGPRKSESNACILTTWIGRYYKLEKPYSQKPQIFSSSGKSLSMIFSAGKTFGSMPLGIKAYLINPYKRFEYVSKLIDNAFGSLSPSSSPRGSIRPSSDSIIFSDLSRLYSIGNNENTIKKIIKYRKEHELTKVIHKALHPKTIEILSSCFKAIKEHAVLKRTYNLTLAAALILTPLQKVIQKTILANYLGVFQTIRMYAEEVKTNLQLEHERKTKIEHDREENTRILFHLVSEIMFNNMFYGFTVLKELGMRKLQKKTAVLSFGQVIMSKIKQIESRCFGRIRYYAKSMAKLANYIIKAKERNLQFAFDACRNEYKKSLEQYNALKVRKMYSQQISTKSIAFVLTYAISKQTRIGINAIIQYSKPKNPKEAFLYKYGSQAQGNIRISFTNLFTILKSLLLTQKKQALRILHRLLRARKSLKLIFKTLKKARKHMLRYGQQKIEMHAVSIIKVNKLKYYTILHHSILRTLQKQLQKIFTTLRDYSKELSLDMAGPSYSFYSPKLEKSKSGILRSKNNSSVAFVEETSQSSVNFNFDQDSKRLKKFNTLTHSLSISSTPKLVQTMISPRETSVGKSAGESNLLKKALIQKKISEAATRLKQQKPPLSKPPMKPPWKPASVTAVQNLKKISINSTVRRSQYAVQLKERVKSHSKNASADITQCASTPTISSRNSSRQKHSKMSYDSSESLYTNLKFAFMILEKVTQSIKSKRTFESFCRIKYSHRFSPKLPAPHPTDIKPQTAKSSWQNNLYRIGFEKLKQIVKTSIGRDIIKRIK